MFFEFSIKKSYFSGPESPELESVETSSTEATISFFPPTESISKDISFYIGQLSFERLSEEEVFWIYY